MKLNNLKRERVNPTKRRAMTPRRRDRIFEARGRKCYICGDTRGPFDIEHPIALGLGGSDQDEDLFPVCAPGSPSGCHKIKTALDLTAISDAKRKGAKDRGEWREPKVKLQGRGFAKNGPKRKIQSPGFPKKKPRR